MKKSIYLLAASIGGVILIGCNRYDYTPPPDNLRVVSSDVSFDAAGGTGKIEVVSGGDPITAASNKPEWCTVSVSGTTVTVTVPPHTGISNRTAIVTISSGVEREQVPVTQGSMFLTIEADALDVPGEGEVYVIPFFSALDITLTQSEDWITVEIGEDEITIEVAKNPLGMKRSGTLVFESGALTHRIAVEQAASLLTYKVFKNMEWTLSYTDLSSGKKMEIPIVFANFVNNSLFKVSGWPGHTDPTQIIVYNVGYVPASYGLTIAMGQKAYTDTAKGVDLILGAWDNVTNKYTWEKTVKLAAAWDMNAINTVYTFEDNGTWSGGNQVRAIVLGEFVGDVFQGGVSTAMSNLTMKGSAP